MAKKAKAANNKIIAIVLIVLGVIVVIDIGLLILFLGSKDEPVVITVNNLNIPVIQNIVVENSDKVVYETDDLKLVMEPAKEENFPVGGTTRDDKEWKKDGDKVVVDGKTVTVEKNTKDKDNGKIAAVASALDSKTGYTKGVDDYNHNYAIYYMEAANCLLYYPKQLVLVKENEDQSLFFRDPRSNAELKVTLDENEFASMDEVESLIANSEYSTILASGTDWFSAETYGKNTTTFSLTGLGNQYSVTADLTYEKKYNFVFEELRKLLKCQFVGDGIWVSNATEDSVGKKVAAVEKSPSAYDPVLKRTSYYSEKLNCVVAYPDIFTKQYEGDSLYFTDPVTGAVLEVTRFESEMTIGEAQSLLNVKESNLVSDHSLRASNDNEIVFVTVRDGYLWTAIMTYDEAYKGIYSYAYDMLEICIEGDDVNTTEMKEIYFPAFHCYVVLPMQYEEYGTEGDIHLIKDTITGMEARLSFTEIADPSDYNNLYSVFHVVAEDGNVLLDEDMVKWHNIDGLNLGAAGRDYAALLELSYPNAYEVYKNCWKDFGIYFFTGEELETDAEAIRDEVLAAVVLDAAKEEVIDENTNQTDIFAKSDAEEAATEANTATTLSENGKKQAEINSDAGDTKTEPNRVLVYKTENDYMDVTTNGEAWLNGFVELFPRPADTRQARYYVVLYSMNVLAYNGYTIPDFASDAYHVADVVDEYVRALDDCGERIDTQLGEGIISVFEVLCYYLGIDEVPRYVIKDYDISQIGGIQAIKNSEKEDSGKVDSGKEDSGKENSSNTGDNGSSNTSASQSTGEAYPNDAKKTFESLPFSEVSNFAEVYSGYGSLTNLYFDMDDIAKSEMLEAIEELYALGFVCVDKDLSEWEDEYRFSGYLPGTQEEMLIYVDMNSDYAVVFYLLKDGSFFHEPGVLCFYGIDYGFDFLCELKNSMHYFVNGVERIEAEFGEEVYYRFTCGWFDTSAEAFRSWTQGEYDDDEERYCSVIESGYYDAAGQFVKVRTYVYMATEGYTLCFDQNGDLVYTYGGY